MLKYEALCFSVIGFNVMFYMKLAKTNLNVTQKNDLPVSFSFETIIVEIFGIAVICKLLSEILLKVDSF